MTRPTKRLLAGVALLLLLTIGLTVLLSATRDQPLVIKPPTDAQILQQAEANPMGFLALFAARPWRDQPEAVRHCWATVRFELAVADVPLPMPPDSPQSPTTSELGDAYHELQATVMLPLISAYSAVPAAEALTGPRLAACQAQYRHLRPKVTAARQAYIRAHLEQFQTALATGPTAR